MPELSGVRDNTGTSLSTVNSCLSVPLQKSSRRSLDLYMHDAKKQTKLKMKPENLVRYYIRFKSAPRTTTPIYQISHSIFWSEKNVLACHALLKWILFRWAPKYCHDRNISNAEDKKYRHIKRKDNLTEEVLTSTISDVFYILM